MSLFHMSPLKELFVGFLCHLLQQMQLQFEKLQPSLYLQDTFLTHPLSRTTSSGKIGGYNESLLESDNIGRGGLVRDDW